MLYTAPQSRNPNAFPPVDNARRFAMSGSRISRREVIKAGAMAAMGLAFARVSRVTAQADLPLITKPIPSSGEQLPVIGIGTNAFGVSAPEARAQIREVLDRLPKLGGKVVDTARVYGTSEEVIGSLVEELGNRDSLFIATKTPMMGDISQPDNAVQEAFRRLRTDRLDLLQIHNFYGLKELMPALQKAKESGSVRYIGVSTSTDNQYPQLLAAMREYPLDFIQVDYSIDNRSAEVEVLPLAQERKLAVLINVPFGGRRNAASTFQRVKEVALPDFAAEFDAQSWAQVFLKYVVSHPAVTATIPGTTKVTHLEDNQRAGRGRLPDAAMRKRIEEYWDSLSA